MSGWIKLHRSLLDWEWYDDINTKVVFIHLLLIANHKDNQWRGIDIKRGQRLTSLSGLAKETGLSVKNIRTAIKHLKATNEVASHSTAQHTVFTVVNYDLYQEEANEVANEGQARGKQVATNKNDKNDKNDKKTTRRFSPPSDIETVSYFESKGSSAIEAEKFWLFYDSKNWMVGKSKMKKWQSAASGWITRNKADTNGKDIMKLSSESNWHEEDLGL